MAWVPHETYDPLQLKFVVKHCFKTLFELNEKSLGEHDVNIHMEASVRIGGAKWVHPPFIYCFNMCSNFGIVSKGDQVITLN